MRSRRGKHSLVCDQPVEDGGSDEGMTPPELLLSSLGSCAAYYASAYLRKKGLPRDGVQVHVSAGKAGPPARLDDFKIAVKIPLTLSQTDRAGRRCGRPSLPDSQHAAALAVDSRSSCITPAMVQGGRKKRFSPQNFTEGERNGTISKERPK